MPAPPRWSRVAIESALPFGHQGDLDDVEPSSATRATKPELTRIQALLGSRRVSFESSWCTRLVGDELGGHGDRAVFRECVCS